ncbi:hypothetical protein [Absidia glauca]|uniref:Uncharacterized protein n=1 Tax=Absidia glauca TaxID=4829 RepID=A0A168SHH7_ABSGL|nr:hypothetical protein [Absidia glauca]
MRRISPFLPGGAGLSLFQVDDPKSSPPKKSPYCPCSKPVSNSGFRSARSKREIPIVYKIQAKPKQSRVPLLNFGPRNEDSNHGDGYKSSVMSYGIKKEKKPASGAKSVIGGYRIYIAKVGVVFRNPLSPKPNLTTRPSSPGAREPLSVAASFDLPRKRRVLMQIANVSHGKIMDKMVRRRELPCARRSKSLIRGAEAGFKSRGVATLTMLTWSEFQPRFHASLYYCLIMTEIEWRCLRLL